MFPLRDHNPTVRPPLFTVSFLLICVAFFLYQLSLAGDEGIRFIYRFGLVPGTFTGTVGDPQALRSLPEGLTLVTSMFLHGGWMHLIGNMMFLWIFGNNIEDLLGHARFVLFYLLCGAAAAAAQIYMTPQSTIPMVGASGAISGVLAAYILIYPKARVDTLVFLGFFITHVQIRAVWFIGIWFGLQVLNAAVADNADTGGVAWWAHIGGFVAGAVLIAVLKPKKKYVFSRRRRPWE